MKRIIKVVSWNIGGAKYLMEPKEKRRNVKSKINDALKSIAIIFEPHFFLLQEIVKYGDPSNPEDLIDNIPDYTYDASIAIDTKQQKNPIKWQKYYGKDYTNWDKGTYLAQGYGILWRKNILHTSIWNFSADKRPEIEKEIVRIDTGMYTGDRDTEPRLAVVTHFIVDIDGSPIDIFTVNLHLTTLKGEREGYPGVDNQGSTLRLRQIDIVLNGIVTRYNKWRNEKYSNIQRPPAVWILAGDFNATPNSPEIRKIKLLNFIDLNPDKGHGTKGSGFPIEKATIALDYIFAGPSYYALDPYFVEKEIKGNKKPLDEYKVSDHFPIFGKLPITLEKIKWMK